METSLASDFWKWLKTLIRNWVAIASTWASKNGLTERKI
jgi:hypothetical protein